MEIEPTVTVWRESPQGETAVRPLNDGPVQ